MPRLAITRLQLSHLRSHKSALIEGDGRPVAIYGPNGAGKTNILEALSLLSPGRGLRRATGEDLARAPERIGWKIRATLEAPDRTHQIETGADAPDAPRFLTIDDKPAPQFALGRIARVIWLIPSMDRLWLDTASERRRFLDRITLSLEPGHGETVLAYEKAMRERNRLLKDQVRDPAWYAGLEAQMAQAGARITRNRAEALDRLMAAQTGAATSFPRANLALVGPEDSAPEPDEDRLRAALGSQRPRDMAAGRTLSGPHRDDLTAIYAAKDMPARHCSTGEQKALLISVILANARALAEDIGAAPIILLDEVAAHLDPERRRALYDEVCALGAQAWMTGTDAALFTPLQDRALWLHVTGSAEGVSTVETVDPAPA
ncbi:DNA replication/repair protein RecF [Oceanibium sediminis]|uniref:DNA replication/repair protein RecF n=1 Tax=Oceanibium sediminis TaxID=2026339 RepID=UPI000DD43713|nr:DNA replication/repair protein RecF [Oceanibium sediminis]